MRGQVDLSDFSLMKFIVFFNEYFLSHPLLRFSSKLPFIRSINSNYVKLVLSDIDFFFDISSLISHMLLLPYYIFPVLYRFCL